MIWKMNKNKLKKTDKKLDDSSKIEITNNSGTSVIKAIVSVIAIVLMMSSGCVGYTTLIK